MLRLHGQHRNTLVPSSKIIMMAELTVLEELSLECGKQQFTIFS